MKITNKRIEAKLFGSSERIATAYAHGPKSSPMDLNWQPHPTTLQYFKSMGIQNNFWEPKILSFVMHYLDTGHYEYSWDGRFTYFIMRSWAKKG